MPRVFVRVSANNFSSSNGVRSFEPCDVTPPPSFIVIINIFPSATDPASILLNPPVLVSEPDEFIQANEQFFLNTLPSTTRVFVSPGMISPI